MLHPSEHEMIHGFIRGSGLLLHLASKHLIAIRSSFPWGVHHVRVTKKICIEAYRGDSQITLDDYNRHNSCQILLSSRYVSLGCGCHLG